MFLDILTNATKNPEKSQDFEPVCLPSARSYKDLMDENLRLHSTVLNTKVEIEKLMFVNKRQTAEIEDLKTRLVAKKAKYKSVLSQRDTIIAELQKRLEGDLLSMRQSFQTERASEAEHSSHRIASLDAQLETARKHLDASIQDCEAIRLEHSQCKELISSTDAELSRLRLDNTALRDRLSMFGIQAPWPNSSTNEPRPILLLSQFNQIQNN